MNPPTLSSPRAMPSQISREGVWCSVGAGGMECVVVAVVLVEMARGASPVVGLSVTVGDGVSAAAKHQTKLHIYSFCWRENHLSSSTSQIIPQR